MQIELLKKDCPEAIICALNELKEVEDADMYIIMKELASGMDICFTQKPVLLNSVLTTLNELKAPSNIYRFNGWNGFITNKGWEIAGEINEHLKEINFNKEAYEIF